MRRLHLFMSAAAVLGTALTMTACRSEADYMAEFCLDFDNAVQNSHGNCSAMAESVNALLRASTKQLHEDDICATTTACLPCRQAVRDMLRSCGYSEEMKPVYQKMRFSSTLRNSMSSPDEEALIL